MIGLTVVSIGTSLPELIVSLLSSIQDSGDMSIGNIMGSNIFNILFVVALSALIVDIPFAKAFTFDSYVAIAAAVLLWVCVLPKEKLARWAGALMLASYGVYLWYLI